MPRSYPEIAKEEFKLLEETGMIYICNPGISFNRAKLLEKTQDAEKRGLIEQFMQLTGEKYIKEHVKNGVFSSKLNNVDFSLKENEDFYYDGFKSRNDY